MLFTSTNIVQSEAAVMGLRNKLPELLAQLGWDSKTFAGYCLLGDVSTDTAYRLLRGEVDFRTSTLEKVRKVLGARSISDIIDSDDPSIMDQQ